MGVQIGQYVVTGKVMYTCHTITVLLVTFVTLCGGEICTNIPTNYTNEQFHLCTGQTNCNICPEDHSRCWISKPKPDQTFCEICINNELEPSKLVVVKICNNH